MRKGPSPFGGRAHQEKQSVFNARITLPAHKSNQTEQDNLLSRIPQSLNDLQASLPAEYNVLAGLVSLPPAFTFCHKNSDNFSDRTNSVSAYRSLSFPMLSPVGPWSAPGWVLSILLLFLIPSPCPATTQDYFLNQLDLKIPLSKVLPDALHHEGDKKWTAALLLISSLFSVEASRPQVLLKRGRELSIYLPWPEAKPLIPLSILQC